jgi:filamentous hemagglutinin family protein
MKVTSRETQRPPLRERTGEGLPAACRSGSLVVLLSAAAGSATPATLPVPCANGSCGPNVPTFVSSGTATAQQSGKTLTVNQQTNSAALNWYSFNVSADGKVVFAQPSATAVALNRIYQASPSSIFGSISANGQIYLVNPNGFVFGPNSTVNAGGLLASTLNISDAVFAQGILNPALLQNVPPTPALASDGRMSVIDAQGNAVLGPDGKPIPVQIVVEPGAQLSAASGGRVMLASQSVQNGGSLSAPDGQVVIAAGAKVYLQASSDPALRGLIVEVDSGGTAWNQVTGSLSAPRGNVSMVGLAVNQDGRISATTTVAANGSVSLVAADTTAVINSAAGTSMQPQRGGNLELGPQSSVDIEPELASTTTAVIDQPQLQTSVTLTGQQIVMHSGAAITAPSGNVTATAVANPSLGIMAPNPSSQLRIDSGASIDVAGSTAQLPMSANIVAVQLNASQLADDPVNRDGFLHGQTVYVDSRVVAANGNPGTAVANVSSAIAAVPQNVAQRTSAGGTVSLESEGDVVVAKSATINVSGGQIDYASGVVATTQLIASNGQTYDIGQASPNLTYVGLINPTFTQTYPGWGVTTTQTTPGTGRYQPPYVQGAPAGTLHVAAPNIVLSGDLVGSAVNGPYQRTPGTLNPGGELEIGLPQPLTNLATGLADYLAPPVQFAAQAPNIVIADGAPIAPGQLTLDLPVAYLSQGGFTRTAIYSNQSITLPSGLPLNLAPGSSFVLSAPRIEVDSGITAPSGSLQFSTVDTMFDPSGTNPQRQGIDVAAGVALDVRGLWTNDQLNVAAGYTPTGQTAQAGGTIALTLGGTGGKLTLGDGSALEASGGGWLAANGALNSGGGGKIALSAGGFADALQIGRDVALDAYGVQSAAGGAFTLTTNRIGISQGNGWSGSQTVDERNAPGGTLQLLSGLFSQFGFSLVNLSVTGPATVVSANADLLTVHPGTSIVATGSSLLLGPGDITVPTAPSVMGFASVGQLPVGVRPAESVSLSYVPPSSNANPSAGQIMIGPGAGITVDPRGGIALSSSGSIDIEGTLRAPGGHISAVISAPTQVPPQTFPDQGILIGPHAVVDVSGIAVYQPSTGNGLTLGSVLPGGSVELLTQNGNVTTKAGSLIDVTGTNASLDVVNANNAYSLQNVGTAGGGVVISSAGTIDLGGAIREQPGTDTRAPGGSLTLGLVGTTLPSGTREIEIGSGPGAPPASASSDGLFITGPTLQATGAASLTLRAAYGSTFTPTNPNQPGALIQIDPGVSLSMTESLTLDAPALGVSGGAAVLKAPAVTLTNSSGSAITSGGTAGTGTLSVQAGFIDLLGSQIFQGVGQATLTSSGDLRLDSLFYGSSSGTQYSGGLSAGGNLTLTAARVYPSTLSQFTLTSTGPTGRITIEQSGASPGVPLSAAGSVTLQADQIVNSGTLYAPFGQLSLQATDALTLAPGSVTSVSASGLLVPYGNVQNSSWLYQNGQTVQSISGIPARQVSLSAPSITLAKGASVDLRGGGDLYAYEWVPGTGGSSDTLANSAKTGLYAILPQLQGQYGPYDPEEFATSGLTTGASVYLAGGAGLPAGVYPLLPARYALLPGSFLVQEVAGSQGTIVPGLAKSSPVDTPLVAGYLTFDNTGLGDALYSAFAVYPGSYGRQLATYQDSYASSFFSQAASQAGLPRPPLPADAGALLVNVTAGTQAQLNILGQVLTTPASGGLAGAIDISAQSIEVVANSGTAAPPGSVQLVGSVLTGWNAGQLLLGGQRSADGSSISVSANDITVDSGVTLSGQDVTLVAGSTIDVKPGATLASDSGLNASAAPATAPPQTSILLEGPAAGNAALLAVSDTELPIATRTNSGAPGGTVTVEAGAGLKSAGAIAVEAPGAITLAGSLSDHGASVSLVTGDIRFGGSSGTAGGLTIGPDLLAVLQQAHALRLSATSIDVLANTTLGLGMTADAAPTLGSLTLVAGSINATPAVTAAFGAKSLTLEDNAGGTAAAGSGTGQLTFSANDLTVGPGTVALNGFGTTTMNVTDQLSGAGTGRLLFGGDAVVNAGVITGSNAANLSLTAPNGKLSVTAASSTPAAPAGLGALVSLGASLLDDQGAIVVPGGAAILSATQSLSIGSGAVIDASGRSVTIAGQSTSVPGGSVSLASGGTLSVAAGSRIDVSGGAGADAGIVSIAGAGLVQLNGGVSGAASGGARGGSFSLDAGQLSGSFDALATAVQAGGFSTAQSYRVHNGDLALGAGQTVTANQVELVADSGNIDVAGVISAPAADLRGSIALFAGQNFELMSTGQLHADSAAGPRGGSIEIGTTHGGITLDPGSAVSALGTQQLGTLTLRAPKVASDDVAVSPLTSTNLSGVSQVIVEPVLTTVLSTDPTSSTSLDAPTMSAIQAAASTYMAGATGVITTRLAAPSSVFLVVEPAVELQSAGAVAVTAPLDLSTWRFSGQPVELTVRASGPLTGAGSISDGQQPGNLGPGSLDLIPGSSSSIGLVAGADLASANPRAVTAGLPADLTIDPGVVITTGTGNISLAASRNVIFGGMGATVYTTGLAGVPTQGFAGQFSLTVPTAGGNVGIQAGGDLIGSPISQSVSDWQVRGVTKQGVAVWGVDLSQFNQLGYNVATLGGGDLALVADGNLTTLSAAAADSRALMNGVPVLFGSGGLAVRAAADINSSQFYLADGAGRITAGGSFGSAFNDPYSNLPVGTLLAQGNSQLALTARGSLLLATDVNPTIIVQPLVPLHNVSTFLTYGGTSSLNAMSAGGSLTFDPNSGALQTLLGQVQANTTNPYYLEMLPATVRAGAPSGDVTLGGSGSFILMPSTQGQLSLLAGHDLLAASSGTFVTMSDAPAGTYPTLDNPKVVNNGSAFSLQGALHVGDTQPVIIAAGEDVSGLGFQLPKAAEISAGRDAINLSLIGQNLAPTDTTVIMAGRDIVEQPNQFNNRIEVGGPGALDLLAGRNINLGASNGVTTTGRLTDSFIADPNGSSITLWTGLATAPSVSGLVSDVVAKSPSLQAMLVTFMEQQSGTSGLTFAQAQSAFLALPFVDQEPFIADTFFGELLQSGLAAATSNAGYAQGYAAIDALFPGSRSGSGSGSLYQGDVQLPFSRIYTLSGGDISVVAPGGLVNVGLAFAPVGAPARTPSELGIVAQGAGDVRMFTSGDVDVNASRVFTLLGGNIQIWSDYGSIDAGRGSKTSISAPPPQVVVDAQGNVTLDFSGAVAGSGIRTIITEPGVSPGNVYLTAPVGTVNAGDAGIVSAGDLYVSAAHVVVGSGGFNAGGVATGVPPAVSGLGAALSGASSAASSATNTSSSAVAETAQNQQAAAPIAESQMSWLDVFVEGFGSENCKPDDVECLKRNAGH